MNRLLAPFTLRRDEPNLLLAQYEALATRIPILYVLLIINAIAVAITHIGTAPFWLAAYIPVSLCFVCIGRLTYWQLQVRTTITPEQAYTAMVRIMILAGILTLCFGGWAVALYQYGNPYQQGQIAYFLVIAGISCVFCLMHLPPAAYITTSITLTTMVLTFLFSGVPVFVATALSVVFLSFAFVRVIASYFENFAGFVRLTDVLARKQEETERLSRINSEAALTDQLTGLANRRSFFQTLERGLRDNPMAPPPVLLVDLDGFKPVNDVFGHTAGDTVLKEAARRFGVLIDESAHLARLGGDEFGVVLPSGTSRQAAGDLAIAFCATLKEPFDVCGGSVKMSGSCGIAYSDDHQISIEEIYERADFALYQVKQKRTGSAEFFSPDHMDMLTRRRAIELDLQACDLEAELSLVYQPVIELSTRTVVGFEALARWQNPRLGAVGPDNFIPAAERIGIIGRMTRILLVKALDGMASMPAHLRVAFNLSARDMCDSETALSILSIIQQSSIDPARIELEITETALLSDFSAASDAIRMFRAAGMTIALDDFGTGFSSLSHVHKLEFDTIKIDKSFVMQADDDIRCMNIIRSVATLCQNLGIHSVAEGIETARTADELQKTGVVLGQGYHFSRPLTLAKAIEFAAEMSAARTESVF